MLELLSTCLLWHKLAIRVPSPIILHRLASSWAFSRHGVLPQHVGIHQPQVHIIIFIITLSHLVYNEIAMPF